MWEGGAGWATDGDAEAWAEAGFNVASLPLANQTAMVRGLGRAAAFGMFVLGSAQGQQQFVPGGPSFMSPAAGVRCSRSHSHARVRDLGFAAAPVSSLNITSMCSAREAWSAIGMAVGQKSSACSRM